MSKSRSASRRSPAEWALLVEACERSGLTRAAFAEREGIHPGTFAFWASRLAPKQRKKANTAAQAASAFVPVRVRGRDADRHAAVGAARGATSKSAVVVVPEGSTTESVEIGFANGRRVRFALTQVGDPRLAMLLALAEGGRAC